MKKRMTSLFTGAGGLDWGFHNSGNYEINVANEILKPHLKTYTDNHDLRLIDIENYSTEENVAICGDIHDLNVNVDSNVVIGGPPCQDFSVLRGSDNRAGFTVKRGKLYEQFLRILKSSTPDIFVFENVVGMVSANKGAAYQTIQKDFINAGYDLIFNEILNMANIGVPQARKRLIIIGINKNIKINNEDVENIINKYLRNSILEKYPLVPLEIFEGKILTDLQKEYEKIMKDYNGCMDDIDNESAEKWKIEYRNLTFDVKKDYLMNNNVEDYDEMEFKGYERT